MPTAACCRTQPSPSRVKPPAPLSRSKPTLRAASPSADYARPIQHRSLRARLLSQSPRCAARCRPDDGHHRSADHRRRLPAGNRRGKRRRLRRRRAGADGCIARCHLRAHRDHPGLHSELHLAHRRLWRDRRDGARYLYDHGNGVGLGQSKTYFRGFPDGDYDIDFDGIPFYDTNTPTHHSWAFFPAQFLGGVDFDRSPGTASTIGPTPFGGSIHLLSRDLRLSRTSAPPSPAARSTLTSMTRSTTPAAFGPGHKFNLTIDVHHMQSHGYQTLNNQTATPARSRSSTSSPTRPSSPASPA